MAGLAGASALGWVYESNELVARVLRGAVSDSRRMSVDLSPVDLSGWSDRTVDILWAGHATVLINFHGVHILTDPVLFDWCGAQFGIATIGRKRLVSSALDPDRMPRIDLVLLSHAHMDPLDLPSLARVSRNAQAVTAPLTSDIIAGAGVAHTQELRWGQGASIRTGAGDVQVTAVEVKTADRWRTGEVAADLDSVLGPAYRTEDWQQQNRSLFQALQLEKLGMSIILLLIVLVAAFNIVSTLTMVVADKTREIGILKAMGMTGSSVRRIFFAQGVVIGFVGTLLGLLLGVGTALAVDHFRLIRLDPSVYFIDRLPVSIDPLDVGLVLLASLGIAALATLYPARQAARLFPIEAIRHE